MIANNATHLTPEQEGAIAAAFATGTPLRSLVEGWHIGEDRLRGILTAHGLGRSTTLSRKKGEKEARRAKVASLWDSGLSIPEIADQAGITRDLVRRLLLEAGYHVAWQRRNKRATAESHCRCCEIVLSESADARHEVEVHDGLCFDCHSRYVLVDGTWQRRADFVLDLTTRPQECDDVHGSWPKSWTEGTWALIEKEG